MLFEETRDFDRSKAEARATRQYTWYVTPETKRRGFRGMGGLPCADGTPQFYSTRSQCNNAKGGTHGCDICEGFDDTLDGDGDGVPNGCDICAGFDDGLDADGDGIRDGFDVCSGDNSTGDGDLDGICADRDCDDGDSNNTCPIFKDGFESGDTSGWS